MDVYRSPISRQVSVDFGEIPVSEKLFTIIDNKVTEKSYIIAGLAYKAPIGKDLDEIEMDDLQIRCQSTNGYFNMFIKTADGSYLSDKFIINYLIG